MNLLYYCDEYPPARSGGMGTVVKFMAEAMASRGHGVFVVGKYWEGKGKETVEKINGVTIIRLHKKSFNTLRIKWCGLFHSDKYRWRKAQYVFLRTQELIEKVISRYKIDVLEMPDYVDEFIHYDSWNVGTRKFSIPMLIRVHGSVSFLHFYFNGQEDENKVRQDKAYFSKADAICAVSEFSGRYVKEHLCLKKDVDVIYNPIDDGLFENTKTADSSNQNILFFGKIVEMKGVFSLMKAFNVVAKKHPGARLKLIGNGEVEKARQLIEPQFSDQVEFVGFLPHEQIVDEIDKASFCVIPSYFETFSMAAVEVMARRRALVFTIRASGKELVEDGVNGLLVDPDQVDQIAEKMKALLSDVELRDQLAEAGYEMCRRRFSSKVIVPEMEAYYEKISGRKVVC